MYVSLVAIHMANWNTRLCPHLCTHHFRKHQKPSSLNGQFTQQAWYGERADQTNYSMILDMQMASNGCVVGGVLSVKTERVDVLSAINSLVSTAPIFAIAIFRSWLIALWLAIPKHGFPAVIKQYVGD